MLHLVLSVHQFLSRALRRPGPRLRSAAEYGFRVVSEQQLYSRWLALYNRTISFPAHGSVPVRHRWDPPDRLCSVASTHLILQCTRSSIVATQAIWLSPCKGVLVRDSRPRRKQRMHSLRPVKSTAHDTACPCASQEQQHEFDIVGHPRAGFSFVVIFPFHPSADGGSGGEVRLFLAPPPVLLPHAQARCSVEVCVMAWCTLCCPCQGVIQVHEWILHSTKSLLISACMVLGPV